MVGQVISHYKILEKLGEGGMGIVYKAQDTKLDRFVALKFLPVHLAQSELDKSRLLQEAKAAASLNHPNVCSVIDIQEFDGRQFIVMEYVEGSTLREKLPIQKVQDGLQYAIQIGEALQAAHAKGIVHRDVKSENIMLSSDGRIKVMDFGLAKLKGSLKLTRTSSTVGTLAYMAPEQLHGGDVDARSDIFSYGVVLFEIFTGRFPFRGEHEAALMYSIVNEEPESVLKYREDLNPELDRIIIRTLEKDPADRYQHIDDMVSELRRLQKGSSRIVRPDQMEKSRTSQTINVPLVSSKKINLKNWIAVASIAVLIVAVWALFLNTPGQKITSIAVLSFQNNSSTADNEYLSDGLTESLIFRLSQLPNLKVSPTSSVFRYKGKDADPITIGSELGVQAVMSGRIVQRGENLTISVELVDVRNNNLLWGEKYERTLSDLLSTQREIAGEIVQKLQLKLSGEEQKTFAKHYTESNEAYQLYLRGQHHFAKRTKEDILRGIEYFRQAIALDPNFALAYARIAEAYASIPAYPYLSPQEAFPKAKEAAQRALEIDPNLSEAHTQMAYVLAVYDWNWKDSEKEFKRALELDPASSAAHFRYSQMILSTTGRMEEAIVEVKRAMEMEPLDVNIITNMVSIYTFAGQNGPALDLAKKAYELEPNFPPSRWALSQAYFVNGMYKEMASISEEGLKLNPKAQSLLRGAGIAYAKLGRRLEAEDVIRRFRAIEKTGYIMSCRLSAIYAALGETEMAFAELDKAFAHRDWDLFRIKVDPFMDPLRSDPRFNILLKKIGLLQ
ncbi:MAG: protein kinase [Bacteroidota bacterium]|nr:protein kinase [Bacteroidota bacterium]